MNDPATRATRLRAARWLFAVAIFGSTMAIGAVHVAVLGLVTLVLLAAVVLAFWRAEPLRARRSATLLVWTSVGLTLWTALSAVPMPAAALARLSPHAADVWARCLSSLVPARAGLTWATLSLDPVATRVEMLRGVAYTLAFVVASRVAARREGALFLERALIVTGLALGFLALVHPALGAEKVFGVYAPRRAPGLRHMAPILNANVLSEYLNVALSLLVGQLLSQRPAWPRSVLGALGVGLVATEVWVASRGGVVGAVLAVVLVAWLSRSRGPEREGVVKPFIVPGLLLLAGIGMGVVAWSEPAMNELASLELSKLELTRNALEMVPDFPFFGVGRGAFESVYPAYRSDPSHVVYTHPENFIAQWTTEWGVVAALVAFATLAFALRPSTAMARSPRAAGAWGAIACVAVQNLVDFGSEFPAVVIALITCAAIVTGGTSGTVTSRMADIWSQRPKAVVVASVLASTVAIALVLPGFHHDVFEDRAALRSAALDASVTRSEFDALAEAAMRRHPAEPYLPFTGALRAMRTGEGSLMPWVERTLERARVYGPAHLLLARWLTPRSPGQARLEYRLASQQAPELLPYVEAAAPSLVRTFEDANELLPLEGPSRAGWAEFLAASVRARLPATSRRLEDIGASEDPDNFLLARRRSADALADVLGGDDAPWCVGDARPACVGEALDRAARVSRIAPASCSGYATHARLVLDNGHPQQALRELRAAADTVSDRTACFEALAELATLAKSEETVDLALTRLTHAGCADDAECVENLRFVARVEAARGNERTALAALERARVKAPFDDGLLEQVAMLASRSDLHAEALADYQLLATRHPSEPRWPAAAQAEKLALVRSSIPY